MDECLNNVISDQLINHMSDYVHVMDTESRFIKASNKQIEIMGYKNPDQVLGNSYHRFKNISTANVEAFRAQDLNVLNNAESVRYLSFQCYVDKKWHLLLGDKTYIKNKADKAIGIFSQAKDMTDSYLIDFSRFLFDSSRKYSAKKTKEGFNYIISSSEQQNKYSDKELEVIFYFLRGKSANEISKLIFRSMKTVYFHLDSIKAKANVRSKYELFEKLMFEGLMNIIPDNLLLKPS